MSSVYATDAVCLHGEGYALYRGGGLQFLDSDGSVVRQAGAAPRFSGSPSYLAVNHRGDRVAWIRDSRKIQVEAPRNADVSFRSRASAYGYGWWDDGTLLFFYGAGLQLLDLESGTSRALRLDLRSLILDQLTEPGALVRHVSDVGKADTEVTLDDVQVTPDIVWLLARIGHRGTGRQVGALFTIDRASNRLTVQDSPGAHQTLTDFATTTDGSAVTSVSTFDNGRRTGIHLSFTGPSSDLLRDGWRPAPDCTRPTYFSGIYG